MQEHTSMVSGVDALYYFAQSGAKYENFYLDVLSQIEDRKREFELLDYDYKDNDIVVKIHDVEMLYSGAGRDGFLWFSHEFFRLGLKDREKNVGIHNIRVQLNTMGIYTIGLKSLIEYVNTVVLEGVTMNYYPVTRIDLNTFLQHDFRYLRKEMFVSKKRNHATALGERTSGYELETYYVGKKPFMLRIYNKKKELATASESKRVIMNNHFAVHGLDLEESIFNVEFELHREFLKQYGIDTIEQALSRAETLFKACSNLIRLIDIDTITQKQVDSPNRRRADTLPIWAEIQSRYSLKEFEQLTTPLNKIERITYRYSLHDAEKSIIKIIFRLFVHNSEPTYLFFLETLQKAKEQFSLKQGIKEVHEAYVMPFEQTIKTFSDEGLIRFEQKLSDQMQQTSVSHGDYAELAYQYSCVYDELVYRGLEKEIPF